MSQRHVDLPIQNGCSSLRRQRLRHDSALSLADGEAMGRVTEVERVFCQLSRGELVCQDVCCLVRACTELRSELMTVSALRTCNHRVIELVLSSDQS